MSRTAPKAAVHELTRPLYPGVVARLLANQLDAPPPLVRITTKLLQMIPADDAHVSTGFRQATRLTDSVLEKPVKRQQYTRHQAGRWNWRRISQS